MSIDTHSNILVRQSKGDKSLIIKHNGAGLTYEVVIDLVYDRVLWVYGPEPASTHDITMFRGGAQIDSSLRNNKANWDRSALYFRIPQGKKLIGDSGYKGEPTKISTTVAEHSRDVKEFFARAKSRQETFNTRLKFFNVLSGCFRHGKGAKQKLELHKTCVDIGSVDLFQVHYCTVSFSPALMK
jgi:hypothetical protein